MIAAAVEQKIASMLMVHVPGLDQWQLGGYAAAYGLGGLILIGENIPARPTPPRVTARAWEAAGR